MVSRVGDARLYDPCRDIVFFFAVQDGDSVSSGHVKHRLGGQETMKLTLTLQALKAEAAAFATLESADHGPVLFGETDGKAVGTSFEHKFRVGLGKAPERRGLM